jgi:hypothetical protein
MLWGERGRGASSAGVNRATRTVSPRLSEAGDVTAITGATVTLFGGQSMLRLKLGARDAVSSLWPIRVNPGTQISTRTPSSTPKRARGNPNRRVRSRVSKG